MSVMVIAEPGGTAECDFDVMCELIRVAADCGADVWKPQWVSSAAAHLQRRTANLTPEKRDEFYARYTTPYSYLEWPIAWHREFAWRCHNLGMQYHVSVCLPQDVWALEPYVDGFKVSSFEADDHRLTMTAHATGKQVLVSGGMRAKVECFGHPERMHCTSAYPTPAAEANLRVIQALSMGGYSDHTRTLIAGALAVALGAKHVETHYRLDTCRPENEDYAVSLTPREYAQYVSFIRQAEVMLGDGRPRIQPSEAVNVPYKVSA